MVVCLRRSDILQSGLLTRIPDLPKTGWVALISIGTAIMMAGIEVVFQNTVNPRIRDVGRERKTTRFVAAIRLPSVTNETVAGYEGGPGPIPLHEPSEE